MKSMLKAKGVESDFIELDAGMTRINVKIRAKEETEINGQGPKISADALEQLYQKLETLQGAISLCWQVRFRRACRSPPIWIS